MSSQNSQTSQEILLGYWSGTWRGQPLRMLLEYLGLEYTENRYKWPETADNWFKEDKKNLGLPLPNLPYIVDGQNKITECENIAHYLSVKGGQPQLNGNEQDYYTVQNIKGVASYLIDKVWYASEKKAEEKQKDLDDLIFYNLQNYLNIIGDKEWALGYLTTADFFIYSASMDVYHSFPKQFKERFGDSFKAYWERFEAIPQIKKYQVSNKYVHYKLADQ